MYRHTEQVARSFRSWKLGVGLTTLVVASLAASAAAPGVLAGALLHPARRTVDRQVPVGCADATFDGEGVQLRGWRCGATTARRGTVIYLHGIADTRASAAGLATVFPHKGFDLIAYDSRAHGESDGDACTYGYYERRDLVRVLNTVEDGPIVLVGVSLGAAVALQTAAIDRRVSAIVSVDVFSSLRAIALERAPFFVTRGMVRDAFARAEQDARFRIDDVDVVAAARSITVPVLLIHGEQDHETSPAHSTRVLAALHGQKRLRLVPGAKHNESLQTPAVWNEIHEWIDGAVK